MRNGEVALSARLPIQRGPYSAKRAKPYLFGLLPENEDARAAFYDWSRAHGVRVRVACEDWESITYEAVGSGPEGELAYRLSVGVNASIVCWLLARKREQALA